MNKNFKVQAQGGFTLIELIVVIVILGILAATALPKFANLGADARIASVNAARGAMSSAAAIVHGKYLVNPSSFATSPVAFEGANVAVTTNGYPTAADTGILVAAGLSTTDYKVVVSTDTDAKLPIPATANSINLVPVSLVGTSAAKTCFATYTMVPPSGTTITAPSVSATTSACE